MEAFSLLKYWRGGAATSSAAVHGGATAGDSDNSDEGPFFDLKLSLPLETGSNGSPNSTGSDEKEPKPDSEPVHNGFSRLKSATNFRVLLLKLKKNSDKATKPETVKSSSSSSNSSNSSSKLFTVKFNVEEIPMFKRDNSSAKTRTKKKNERRFSKEMQRYMKMVSKRYGGGGERFSGETEEEEGGGERRRRDDSLVQQQDGIQSAILHCKRSFNSSRDAEMSILSRSVSDPSQKCSEEFKEKGF